MIPPTIIIPGITVSTLRDEYDLPAEPVWTAIRRRRYERIQLHPEDQRYELAEPARIAPGGPFPLVYGELIDELRDGLSEDPEANPAPVYPFGYDWRMPLAATENRLAAFIQEVVDRALLTRPYREDPDYAANPAVNLIGHSMGGLIIAGYIQRHTARLVHKAATLASPFQGSFEAIAKVATGTADLGDDASPGKARERRAARTTPALYHLLPSFPNALDTAAASLESDIFRPEAWQPNVIRSITRQASGWNIAGAQLFRQMLGAAKSHRDSVNKLDLRDPDDQSDAPSDHLPPARLLVIAGVDAETRTALRVVPDDRGAPRFLLRSQERRNEWGSDDPRRRLHTGDGTVPLQGAIPPFLDESRVVCVTPGDFGYWELRDRALSGLAGFHGLIPRMNMVHRLLIRFLAGKPDPYGNTWGRRLPGVAEWKPPLPLREKDAPQPEP